MSASLPSRSKKRFPDRQQRRRDAWDRPDGCREAASQGRSPNKGEEIVMREENDENSLEMTRRRFLAGTAWMTSAITTGVGSWVIRSSWANAAEGPIKIGIATDLTGAIGMAGHANANVAKMVIQDINDAGGVLGRPIELHIEDCGAEFLYCLGADVPALAWP
jgi:ABC-type branched-subunit amino acid transport system substrate-binding protein